MEGNDFFSEIIIVNGGNDVKEFEAKKQVVLDDIFENVEERFGYLENDFVLKVVVVLDLDVWLKDQIELFIYGDVEIELLVNYYEDYLLRVGCEFYQIVREWLLVKSYVSFYLSSRCIKEIFVIIFRSCMDDCCNFLFLVEIVFIWLMLIVVVERGFSSMNRVKIQLRSSMYLENLDGVFRILVKYYLILKV